MSIDQSPPGSQLRIRVGDGAITAAAMQTTPPTSRRLAGVRPGVPRQGPAAFSKAQPRHRLVSRIITNRACENGSRNQLVGTGLSETAYPLTHPWHRTSQPPLTINKRLITIFLRSNHHEQHHCFRSRYRR